MNILKRARLFLFPHRSEDEPIDPADRARRQVDADRVKVDEFGGHIADVIAEIKRLDYELTLLSDEVAKWGRLKGVAVATGDEAAIRQAVEKRMDAQRRLDVNSGRIAEAKLLKTQLEQSYREAVERIDAAKDRVPLLTAKRAGIDLREQLAAADVNGPQSDSAEGAVAALEEDVAGKEAHASAYEQMAAGTAAGASRVADHTLDAKAVDDEVQAALTAAGKDF
jgi:phage shock protein A